MCPMTILPKPLRTVDNSWFPILSDDARNLVVSYVTLAYPINHHMHAAVSCNEVSSVVCNPVAIKAGRTCEMKLKQNTETTLKLFQSCFRLISIFIDMSNNMQIVKLFQAFQPIPFTQ